MANIKIGEQIKTLVCIDNQVRSSDRKAKMQCNVCGYTGEYDIYSVKKSHRPCRLCSHFGKYTFEHIEGGVKVNAYKENNNAVIGWVFTEKGDDFYKYPKNTVRFKCLTCGNVFDIPLKELRSWGEIKCPRCINISNNVKSKSTVTKPNTKKIPVKENAIPKMTPISKNVEKNNMRASLTNTNQVYMDNKNLKLEVKKDDEFIGKKFGTLEVVSVYYKLADGIKTRTNKVRCKCSVCGMEDEYDRYKLNANNYGCKICKQMDTKLYKGKNEQVRDMTGTVINGLKIIKQVQDKNGVWLGEYQCVHCKNKGKAVLVLLNNKEVFCDKCMELGSKAVGVECPNCGLKFTVPYKTLYKSPITKKCVRCKGDVNLQVERTLMDDASTFRNVLGKYSKMGLGLSDIKTDSRLAKFGSVFINRNGDRCYNCYCIEHRQELVLSESEIEEFNHKQCTCEDVEFYKLLNIPVKIKKKEKSIDDIMESK